MLILSRRVGESVIIGEDISVTVLRVKGNQVRLGVEAPKHLSVQRAAIADLAKPEDVAAQDESSGDVVPLDAEPHRPDR